MNRLAGERSPYLLQHAANPVDWFPWGDEAFRKAREEDKPIFLSIGYSTCHWCHVMAHESFESRDVAERLNRSFVPIKVDREERPDVDHVYMTFVQATTGSGGWPMSVWLTPELKPFYGGTYFPPASRWGRPGFAQILDEIAHVWQVDADKVRQSADAVTLQLQTAGQGMPSSSLPGSGALAWTTMQFKQAFDKRHGGFGDAPKFPRPSELLFLLREHARTDDPETRGMVLATLDAMAVGGMRDHIGGGFHRYSVDAEWRVPHFEKMLYDQAQLVLAYLEAAQVSGSTTYLDVAEDTLRYVMREMTDEAGGFYSAEDADSVPPEDAEDTEAHKSEGAFYLWRADELDRLLGEDADIVKRRFGVEPNGNAPADPQQEFAGKNILYVARTVDQLNVETGKTLNDVADALSRARLLMFRARLSRPRPHLDDKVLTAWNGLMIAAFARASRLVRGRSDSGRGMREPYADAARRAATFLFERMWREDARTLLRRYRAGHAEIEAYAEDYAFLIWGLLELFQTDPDPRWLVWAVNLQERFDELFWDEQNGGWFSTTGRDPSVLLRLKEDYDGAEPSPSSVAVMNLLTLAHLIEHAGWTDRIERTLKLFGARLEQMGRAVPMMAAALSAHVTGMRQVVIVGEPNDRNSRELERVVATRYLPGTFAVALTRRQQQALDEVLPLISAMPPSAKTGRAVAYVCRDFACRPAVETAEALEHEL